MAGIEFPIQRSSERRLPGTSVKMPRLLMSWEDWLTFVFVLVAFLSVAISIQHAGWVDGMPSVVWTAIGALVIGLFAARMRMAAVFLHPVALLLGAGVVLLSVQDFADGATFADRVEDVRLRLHEWWLVVKSGDISNDNLPFVTLVHALTFLIGYVAAWSIYRWRNPWLAIVPIGILLLTNISFLDGRPGAAFIVYLFAALLVAARLSLQKRQEAWNGDGTEYPDLISLNVVQLTVVVSIMAMILAWLVPLGTQASAAEAVLDVVVKPAGGRSEDFVRLFHNVDSRKGANLHTFGDTLPIQGNIKLGSRLLLEVKSGEQGLIRGTSYDFYSGTGWRATERDSGRVDRAESLIAPPAEAIYKKRAGIILEVRVVDGGSTVLTAGTPLQANLDAYADSARAFNGDVERLRSRRSLDEGDSYNSIGSASRATAEELRAAGNAYPAWVKERYLQLPKDLPERVRTEAKRVAGAAATPYDSATAIEEYLRSFPYDLDVPAAPPNRDTVDFLLFDLKRGYFDYQATALAVMLRSLGVPARVAVGYVLDQDEANETLYLVRKDDAYSWVEVFFPGYGWVDFNATAGKPAGGAGGFGSGAEAQAGAPAADPLLDELFDPNLFGDIPPGFDQALGKGANIGSGPPWTLIGVLGGLLALIVGALVSARLAWNWGLGGLEGRTKLWARLQRLGGWAGVGMRTWETPSEWSGRLGKRTGRTAEARQLAEAYEETRYGRPDLQRIDESSVATAYRGVRNALLNIVLLRRKPPQP